MWLSSGMWDYGSRYVALQALCDHYDIIAEDRQAKICGAETRDPFATSSFLPASESFGPVTQGHDSGRYL